MNKKRKLHVDDLTVSFKTTQGMVRAVRGVNFDLYEGETLAIVGESGSGKSVSSRAIMGILAGNGVIDKGQIIYEGEDLTKVSEEQFHELRGNKIGMIFQDPMSSLNPIMRIGKQITEGMILNGKRMKTRYKNMFNEARTRYISLQQKRVVVKQEFKAAMQEEGADKVALKAQYQEDIATLNKEIKEAKQQLAEDKRKAKKAVKEDWNKAKAENKVKLDPLLEQYAVERENIKQERREALAKAKEAFVNNVTAVVQKTNEDKADFKARKKAVRKEESLKIKQLRKEFNERLEAARDIVENCKEELRRYKKVTPKEAWERAIEVMNEVGIPQPEKRFRQYPFQFSGGMRQRIVIAIALTADPDILICDEPTTALDVTIQAQILELINRLKAERNLSVIFITHDLGVVANMADRIGVMYAGKIVEIGTAEDIFYDPKHPYTWALLSSMPDLSSKERLTAIPGTPPNMLFPPEGDAFADRNKYAMRIDFDAQPPMFKVSDTHYAATWLLHENAPKVEMPEIIQHRIERMLKGEKGVNV